MNFKQLTRTTKFFVNRELPTILTAFSITTSVGAMILAAKAERNALTRIEDAGTIEETINADGTPEYIWSPPSKQEQRAIYADEFVVPIFIEILSGLASYKSWQTSDSRIAGLSNALALSQAQKAMLEDKLPERSKQEIKEGGVDEKLKEMGELPYGVKLWKDPHYNLFFTATEKQVITAVNAAQSIFEADGYATLGTFYYFLDKQAPAASMVEGFTWEQVVEEWGEAKVPIDYHEATTKAGAKYMMIEYNCDVKQVLTLTEDIILE